MSGHTTADRRPWLIISRREAQALKDCATESLARMWLARPPSEDLLRAVRVLEEQLLWIEGRPNGKEPNVVDTIIREQRS